jgi:uncharacterized protein (DUF2062 family)
MHAFRRRHYRWLKYLPRRKHLKGGRLHRLVGDRLFAPELWAPRRDTMAKGLALGVFIGMTPTMGAQIILTGIAACMLRVNIPIALAGSLVTNPFTAPLIYPLQYQLGVWLVGSPDVEELRGYTGMMRAFVRYAKPLWIGSLFFGAFAAPVAYGLVALVWSQVQHLRHRAHRRAENSAGPDVSEQ